MELRTLEGDSKAIGTDDSKMSMDDEEDDAVQMQKCAAVLFGFSGDLNAAFSAAFQQPLVPAPQQVLTRLPAQAGYCRAEQACANMKIRVVR